MATTKDVKRTPSGRLEMVKSWGRKFSEAWTACCLCMVQGDLTVLSVNHAITASKTGTIAATAYVASMLLGTVHSKWITAWITGIFVALADIVTHPTHFGAEWMEAAVTGLVAASICLTWEKVRS